MTAARGRSVPLSPPRPGWTVFHLPPTLGAVQAVGLATSGRIRAEEVEIDIAWRHGHESPSSSPVVNMGRVS